MKECEGCYKITDERIRKGLCIACYDKDYYTKNKEYVTTRNNKYYMEKRKMKSYLK